MPQTTSDPEQSKQLLAPYRAEIDAIDDAIIDLLARRVGIVHRVAAIKGVHGIPSVLPERIEHVVSRNAAKGGAAGVDPQLVSAIYRLIIANACGLEDQIIYDGRAPKPG